MTSYNLFLLPGDGIGPEVMAEVEKILAWFAKQGIATFNTDRGLVGGCAYDAHGKAISESDMAKAQSADAVLFGAVGGPKWDKVPYDARPEAGLLRLRKDLGLFANLRPAICYPALADASSLKKNVLKGLIFSLCVNLRVASISASPRPLLIWAMAKSAALIRKSMTRLKLNALLASPSIWPQPARTKSLQPRNAM